MTTEELEQLRQYYREYYKKKKNQLSPEELKYHKEITKERNKKYKEANKESLKEKRIEYVQKNRDKIKQGWKNYYENNKERLLQNNKEWFKNNRAKINANKKKRRENDEMYRLSENLRNLIKSSFKRKTHDKESQTEQILGCTFEEFKVYIESKFELWMNWNNYGDPKDGIFEFNKTWDIDHIIPLNTAKTVEDIIRLNHYSNLQPLCSKLNRNVKKWY